MRLSLRLRVLLVVAGINAALFAVGGLYFRQSLRSADENLVEALVDRMDAVGYAVSGSILPQGELNVARILQWPGWQMVADALLIDSNLDVLPDGRLAPRGIDLNPLGSRSRGPGFDRGLVLGALREAMTTRRPVAALGGRAVPIRTPGGTHADVWGACWLRIESAVDLASVFKNVLPLFLISTLLLTAGSFAVLRWLVVEPVRQLAAGARSVQAGDFTVRLPETRRRDEIAELVRTFNVMTETVASFNRRLEDEVRRATAQARRAEAEVMTQRRLAAMGELAAGIAHEINNPLGGLQNAVERIARGDLPEPKRVQYLELLRSGLERIGTTVGQLLRFTPRQGGRGPIDLAEVAREALALVRHRVVREGVATELLVEGAPAPEGPSSLPRIEGLRHDLGQAVLNLLVNALDAVGGSGRAAPRVTVELRVERPGSAGEPAHLLLAVTDNGPGVAEEDLERIFDLFFTTKEVGKGSGLGLSIVHNVVSAHGGRVALAEGPEGGLSVELRFPVEEA